MAIPSSGALSMTMIHNELSPVTNSYSLRTLSAAAGKSTSDSMSEFYGYQYATVVNFTVNEPGGEFWAGCYDGGGGYLGGWYGDHYAYIYVLETGWSTTLTYGGSVNFNVLSGQRVQISSTFTTISYDTSCPMVYQAYVTQTGPVSGEWTDDITLGNSGGIIRTFQTVFGDSPYDVISYVRNIS